MWSRLDKTFQGKNYLIFSINSIHLKGMAASQHPDQILTYLNWLTWPKNTGTKEQQMDSQVSPIIQDPQPRFSFEVQSL